MEPGAELTLTTLRHVTSGNMLRPKRGEYGDISDTR